MDPEPLGDLIAPLRWVRASIDVRTITRGARLVLRRLCTRDRCDRFSLRESKRGCLGSTLPPTHAVRPPPALDDSRRSPRSPRRSRPDGSPGAWARIGSGRWTGILVGLFLILFASCAFPFWMASAGVWHRLAPGSADPGSRPAPGRGPELSPTAVVMPVHNEHPRAIAVNLRATVESVGKTGHLGRFTFFVLSDTTDPDLWLEEEVAWAALAREVAPCRLHYRRRPENTERKAGNIAEFCRRWGRHYEYILVLDADSVMDGATVVEMVRRMDADPAMGILQVPPLPVGRRSLLARWQQFAARLVWSGVRGGPVPVGPHGWQLLGTQRAAADQAIHGALWTAAAAGGAAAGRRHPQPRLRWRRR